MIISKLESPVTAVVFIYIDRYSHKDRIKIPEFQIDSLNELYTTPLSDLIIDLQYTHYVSGLELVLKSEFQQSLSFN